MRRSQFTTKARTPVHDYFFSTEEWDLDDFCKYVLRRDLTCSPTRALRIWMQSLSTIESNYKLPTQLRNAAGNLHERPSVFTWTFKKHQLAVLHRDPMSQRKILEDTSGNFDYRDVLWIRSLQMQYVEGDSKRAFLWFSNDNNCLTNSDSNTQVNCTSSSTDITHIVDNNSLSSQTST
ncbi:hypothetical protein MVEG_01078 [Podila verticillata NRRL 6337]|nr:MAG: hypothetical protein BYD32DRAFT_463149 [Podila humilis]KFH73864.1 hypothetical protein MVEG_01078 [Podila verticillata NRRL 6337]